MNYANATTTTASHASIDEMCSIMDEFRRRQEEADEKFNLSAKTDPCSLCGHIMHACGPEIQLCHHQFKYAKYKLELSQGTPLGNARDLFGFDSFMGVRLKVVEGDNPWESLLRRR